jgi:hypothetical protein
VQVLLDKSIEYEEVYLHASETIHEDTKSIGKVEEIYNSIGQCSGLNAFAPNRIRFSRENSSQPKNGQAHAECMVQSTLVQDSIFCELSG